MEIKDISYNSDNNATTCQFISDNGMIVIYQKWDGCCDITVHYNGSTVYEPTSHFGIPNYSSIHICELKEFIDILNEAYKQSVNMEFEV